MPDTTDTPEIENTEPRTMAEQVAEAWESAAVVDESPLSVELGAAGALLIELVDKADSMDGGECMRKAACAVHIAGVAAALAGKCFDRLAKLAADPATEAGKAAAATDAEAGDAR